MATRDIDHAASPHADADEALALVLERLSDYVIITPRDTSLPLPLVGVLEDPPLVRLVNRGATPAEQALRIWRKVGACLWWALPPQEELLTSIDGEPE